jgi:ribosomal protein S18 acetylase RimI-like enzyme
MKITRRQLRKLINESIYLPPGISKEDIEFGNELRRTLSPEDRAKADALVADDPTHLQGYLVGGLPEEKPDMPMKTLNTDSALDLRNSKYAGAGGMKEIVMAIDDDLYDFLVRQGTPGMRTDQYADPDMEKYYTMPISEVYREFRKHQVDKELMDEIIDHYSYYGYERVFVNMGGRQVQFLSVIDQ